MTQKTLSTLLFSSAIAFSSAVAQQPAETATAPAAQTQQRTVQATAIDTELKKAIDSKKSKPGDEITATIKDKATLSNGTELPKGTTLVGHVTEATPYSKDKGTGSVTVVFDQIKTKDGQTTPIISAVRGLTPSMMEQQMNANNGGGSDAAPMPSAPAGGGSSADGSGGGATSSPSMPSMGSTASSAGAEGTPVPNGMVRTGINGVLLAPSANATTSGTLARQGENLHVSSGSSMQLLIAARQ